MESGIDNLLLPPTFALVQERVLQKANRKAIDSSNLVPVTLRSELNRAREKVGGQKGIHIPRRSQFNKSGREADRLNHQIGMNSSHRIVEK